MTLPTQEEVLSLLWGITDWTSRQIAADALEDVGRTGEADDLRSDATVIVYRGVVFTVTYNSTTKNHARRMWFAPVHEPVTGLLVAFHAVVRSCSGACAVGRADRRSRDLLTFLWATPTQPTHLLTPKQCDQFDRMFNPKGSPRFDLLS